MPLGVWTADSTRWVIVQNMVCTPCLLYNKQGGAFSASPGNNNNPASQNIFGYTAFSLYTYILDFFFFAIGYHQFQEQRQMIN